MLDNLTLENLLLFDIETVPQTDNFNHLPDHFKELWEIKVRKMLKEEETAESFYERAGIYAEFGKIVCISAGYFKRNEAGQLQFRVKSFASDNEVEVLNGFKNLLDNYFNETLKHGLCGHNIREFDVPYVCRRMLIHGIGLPALLDLSGKKPWEVQHLDTMQLWKFGDIKSYTSLKLLAAVFNIPTPKDDIDGNDVARVYWKEKNLQRIATYCQKDVVTVAQLMLRFKGMPLLTEQDITINGGLLTA